MDLSSHPDMTAVATAARGAQLLQFCEAVFGSLPNWQRRMLLQLAAADEPFLVALHPPGRTGSTYVQRIMEETIVAIEERGSRPDQVTFKGSIRTVTDGGAYIITDGTIPRPVPIGRVTHHPPEAQPKMSLDIPMARPT